MRHSLARLACFWALAVAVALVAPDRAGAALPGLVIEDVNNNGLHDGDDHDVTAIVLENGYFSTEHSIIVATALTSRNPAGIALVAGQNLWVKAGLNAAARGASLSLFSQNGTVDLGERAEVSASGYIDVVGALGIYLRPRAGLVSREPAGGLFLSTEGELVVADGGKLIAKGGVDLFALGGQVHLGAAQVRSDDYVGITAEGEVWISASRVQTPSLSIVTFDDLITFTSNIAKFVRGGFAYFSAGSTVDLTRTRFEGLDPDNLYIDAETVVQ